MGRPESSIVGQTANRHAHQDASLQLLAHTPTPIDINRYLQKEMFSNGSGFKALIIGGLVLLFVLAGAEPVIKKILALLSD
jgi:hypothetical protein